MNRLVVAFFVLLMIVGCSTKLIVIERDAKGTIRTIEAEDYSIKTPTLTAVPSRWLTPDFVGKIIEGAIKWQSMIPVVPSPAPVPPTPTPGPYPAPGPSPIPVPTPVPVPPVPTPPTPVPVPSPVPVPTPVASTVFTQSGTVFTLDLNTIPGSMRAAGFNGSDNALFYVMAHIYAYGPGKDMVPHAELDPIDTPENRQAIFNWFDGETLKIIAMMKANPALTLVAISGDGKDRCGFRLGPAIMERVLNDKAIAAGRVQLGSVMNPDDY